MAISETEKKIRDIKLTELARYCLTSSEFDLNLYAEYDVKRGLRESDGKGVLTGLTEISDVVAFRTEKGKKFPRTANCISRATMSWI